MVLVGTPNLSHVVMGMWQLCKPWYGLEEQGGVSSTSALNFDFDLLLVLRAAVQTRFLTAALWGGGIIILGVGKQQPCWANRSGR